MKQYLLAQFDFHHRLFNNVLEEFTDEETNQRVCGDSRMNHVKYLAGHLLNAQYGYSLLAGVPMEPRWSELFAPMNQTKARDDISYPSIQEITDEWNRINKIIRSGIESLSDEQLTQTAPEPLGSLFENDEFFPNSIAGVWTIFNHHQAYHIGQIGILRRGFGKEPMRYDKSTIEIAEEHS